MKNSVFSIEANGKALELANVAVSNDTHFIEYKVKSSVTLQVIETEDSASVKLVLPEAIPGFEVDKDSKNRVLTMVREISLYRSAFTSMICDVDDLVAEYRAGNGGALNVKQLGVIFAGATLTFIRIPHVEGEVIREGKEACKHDCFETKIVDIDLSSRAKVRMEKALDNALEF